MSKQSAKQNVAAGEVSGLKQSQRRSESGDVT